MENNQTKHDLSRKNSITTTVTVDGATDTVGPGSMGAGT